MEQKKSLSVGKKVALGLGGLFIFAALFGGGSEPAKQELPVTPTNTENQPSEIKIATPEETVAPEPEVTEEVMSSETEVPAPAPTPAPKPQANCDPNYTPCVPNVSYDLDCPDIGFSVTVIGNDVHGFDGNDNDGLGCESY